MVLEPASEVGTPDARAEEQRRRAVRPGTEHEGLSSQRERAPALPAFERRRAIAADDQAHGHGPIEDRDAVAHRVEEREGGVPAHAVAHVRVERRDAGRGAGRARVLEPGVARGDRGLEEGRLPARELVVAPGPRGHGAGAAAHDRSACGRLDAVDDRRELARAPARHAPAIEPTEGADDLGGVALYKGLHGVAPEVKRWIQNHFTNSSNAFPSPRLVAAIGRAEPLVANLLRLSLKPAIPPS